MKKLLLTLGAVASVAAPVAAVVACGSTSPEDVLKNNYKDAINKYAPEAEKAAAIKAVDAAKDKEALIALASSNATLQKALTAKAAETAYANSVVGKIAGNAQLDIRTQSAADKTGKLHKAGNADALKAELATLVDAAKNSKNDETTSGSWAKYTFLKAPVATPLLDNLIADGSNGNADTAHSFDISFAEAGETAANVAKGDVSYILINLVADKKVDASSFADKIDGKDAEMSLLLLRVTGRGLGHATPLAFMTPKSGTTIAPQKA